MQFDRPVPGQSLTTTPKGAPYERPPEIVDPLEAIEKHLVNITEGDNIEDILFFLEEGLDLKTLTEGILRSAVMEGIHSIDVSLIIGSVIFEFIRGIAIRAGIDFDEGLDEPEAKQALTVRRDATKARRILSKMKIGGKKISDLTSLEDTEVPEGQDVANEEQPMQQEQPSKEGLMARRV